jgi:hypothetical protein
LRYFLIAERCRVVQTPGFQVQTDFLPTHRSAASGPIGAWGEGIQFSNFLGFAPQAGTIRASGTKTRNFKTTTTQKVALSN